MSGVRVLVGTKKGAFVLTADGRRDKWEIAGPHFGGLGDLPPQGLTGRPEPALRLAVLRLVRAGDPALGRRRQELGGGRQPVHLRRHSRHPSLVRRHPASVGVQARLAPRAVARRPRHGLRRRRGRRSLPVDRRRAQLARARRPPQPRVRSALAARCRRHGPAHDPPRSGPRRPHLHRHLRRRRLPQRRRRRDLAAGESRA